MTEQLTTDELATRFFSALEAGDERGAIACYAPDARIWHNFDEVELTPTTNVESIRQFFSVLPTRRYIEVRRRLFADGFLQQHVIVGTTQKGTSIRWPGCIVCEVRNARIVQLEEYVDIQSFVKQLPESDAR